MSRKNEVERSRTYLLTKEALPARELLEVRQRPLSPSLTLGHCVGLSLGAFSIYLSWKLLTIPWEDPRFGTIVAKIFQAMNTRLRRRCEATIIFCLASDNP
jgi:hypothetical protein